MPHLVGQRLARAGRDCLMDGTARHGPPVARRLLVSGRVQGVGFRPFVHRLAHRLELDGWVRNEGGSVLIHVEGPRERVERFGAALVAQAPSASRAESIVTTDAVAQRKAGFVIDTSVSRVSVAVHLPPDLFVCEACLAEMNDHRARRHRYPFINCTQCGPRFTIIDGLPYDRARTTMAGFTLCPDCAREFETPGDRRFHAQPLACPRCGPRCLFEAGRTTIVDTDEALAATLAALNRAEIVAVKGIGGYHLFADACDPTAVARLRTRKGRPDKPLAVLFPTHEDDPLGPLSQWLTPSRSERDALLDPARPIVLVRRRAVGSAITNALDAMATSPPGERPPSDTTAELAAGIAPGLAEIGAMLPYSPLHHLLTRAFGRPLIATSGNVSGEPVLTDPDDARRRLAGIADAFLHHDRPIARPADDTVLRTSAGRLRPLRIGRGLAPLELEMPVALDAPVLATGGHMKTAIALGFGKRLVLSPHIGDLDSPRALLVFESLADDLQSLYGQRAVRLVCDAHPGYASSRWARARGLPVHTVPHHNAHAASITLDHPDVRDWLVFAWDGVGLGTDGTLWGGEALVGGPGRWQRAGSFMPFMPVGGERAAREPWRSAAALCWQAGLAFERPIERVHLARQAWQRGLNSPSTSAVGRLFDAAASLLLGLDHTSFEGQGPMWLEARAQGDGRAIDLPMISDGPLVRTDWRPLLVHLLDAELSIEQRAADFHETLAGAALVQAQHIAASSRIEAVGLGGGVFQNRRLVEAMSRQFSTAGFDLRTAQRIPVNDGGLSAGQMLEHAATVAVAARA
ncbi:MAG: carbamoyltransferase HypF [Burkholderiaceae bacterium]